MQRRSLLHAAGATALVAATPFVRAQGSLQKFKFNLGWKIEASGAGFLLAQQRGYYKDAGLDVAIDTGNGSASAISLVGSGAYDCASADLATMIEFNVNNPGAGLKAVAIQYDLNPNAILVRKGGPIAKPADLAGKAILGQPFNASRKLFPAFAKAQGFDPSGVKWENVAPDIGDTRFVKGDFDASAYFFFTGLLNLKARGMGPEQITVFRFSDHGMKSYGNGLVANAKSMQEQGDAMKAFVKATTRGWIEAIADPKAGAAAIKAREPLASEEIEHERLKLIVDGTMKTPDTRSNGWGAASTARLQATIDETVGAFGLKSSPPVEQLWTERFLPPAADRKLKA
ncbi:putative ABC transporter, permease protein [Variovorax paradoxus B4]|uniref:Thiamine pyrimidine synthase n=2 Tax=Variovorax paradoxus TaxID=34073 RepID=A0A0H2M5W5_VARPD|nr:ABC transporter substrate-binding protein [Variovorax paradoxus]AGU51183.1 putative ABC transporter, permease protein [Variovorax paradoxus B4]KLN52445.1 NMT1/THI5 like protein [Variovorax paradoxus]